MTRRIILLVGALLGLSGPATGQGRFGPEVGLLSGFDESLFQLGFRVSDPTPGRLGVDFALASFPDGWPEGAVLMLGDLGVATPIPASPTWRLVPHAGVTAFFLLAGDDGGAAAGGHVGLGLTVETTSGPSLRVDWTTRWLPAAEGVRLNTFTLGLAWPTGSERAAPPAGIGVAGQR